MQIDILIIGQGISGTFLSWYLQQEGFSFLVIDQPQSNTASKVAAGVINPVTGRRIVKTWMIDEVLPFALNAYQQLGEAIGVTAIEQKNVIDFFPTPQMKLAFDKRFAEDQQYLSQPADENNFRPWFQYDFGYGEIQPAYLVNLPGILPAYRQRLTDQQQLREEWFDHEQLQLSDQQIQYKDITATYILFADGISSAQSPYFDKLPFAGNKGEAIWLEIPGLPNTHVFKRGFSLIPWSGDIFWLGSTYLWEFDNVDPTPGFRQFAETWLKQTVKLPYKLLDHKAAVRPATLERRPFVGFHPLYPQVGIFNGMGTKGCSLGPFFAQQLAKHLRYGTSIAPEADIQRFKRVLSR
jgi:glycine/D-amino acid oxidase-like deaminating enzyme